LKELLYDNGFLAVHYADELKEWSDADHYDHNVKNIQLPYSMPVVLRPDQLPDKKREVAKKSVEMNAKKKRRKSNFRNQFCFYFFFLLIIITY